MDGNLESQINQILETHKEMVAELQNSGLETIATVAKAIVGALRKG